MSLYDKIHTLESLNKILIVWRSLNKKIVFTNGCFDLLHKGHVDYLERAKNLGDILIVALNNDASVLALKGKNRPIQDEASRLAIIASLTAVDATLLFADTTPIELIQLIKPDVLCKGGDWHINTIIGADFVLAYGGKVITIPFIQGYSTSSIEQKIRNQK